MTTWTTLLFYIVFLSQVLLTSGYLAHRTERRMRHVLDHYPPDVSQKLYPRPV